MVQQPKVSLQQQQPLGLSSLQSSSSLQGPETVSLPLQQVCACSHQPGSPPLSGAGSHGLKFYHLDAWSSRKRQLCSLLAPLQLLWCP